MNDGLRWHAHQDGYYKELWLLDATDRVVGSVSGSNFDKKWYAFAETPKGSERLGQYLDEKAAKRAVETQTKTLSANVEVQP